MCLAIFQQCPCVIFLNENADILRIPFDDKMFRIEKGENADEKFILKRIKYKQEKCLMSKKMNKEK